MVGAGGTYATLIPGGSFVDSATSFAIIRGGHLSMAVLGALEVDEKGNMANWMVPGKMVPGMGGAMDLVSGARKVVVAMEHTTKKGEAKILRECTLPLTAIGKVHTIVTELGIMEVTPQGLLLKALAPGVTKEEIQSKTEAQLLMTEAIRVMVV